MTTQKSIVTASVAVLALQSVACVQNLAPPAAPPKVTPRLDDDLPEATRGQGVVVIGSPDAKARVDVVQGTYAASGFARGVYVSAYGVATKSVCEATPCAVVLPQGEHRLTFRGVSDQGRAGVAVVKVGREPVAVNHTMGQARGLGTVGTTGFWLSFLGAASLGTGALLLAVAPSGEPNSGLRSTGQTMAIAGGLGLGVGLTMFFLDRPKLQEGSTVQFRITPATRAPEPGGLGTSTLASR